MDHSPSDCTELHQLVLDLADAVERSDADAIASMIADDIVVEHPDVGAVVGAEQNLALIRELLAMVRPQRQALSHIVVEGDRCAFRLFIGGTVQATTNRFPPPGTEFEWAGVVFLHVPDGRIRWASIATERSS
jgi:predicted ester cyclase